MCKDMVRGAGYRMFLEILGEKKIKFDFIFFYLKLFPLYQNTD